MKINLQELRENLTEEHIIKIVLGLGAEKYEDKGNALIFPTICHNTRESEASMKLYYYKESHMFHCYTECSENFDIFDLNTICNYDRTIIPYLASEIGSSFEKINGEFKKVG